MAEVLGTVASGIAVAQLAGAIVSSTQKIYTFWKEMKDAPKNIGDLLVEIELLGEVLVEYHTSNGQGSAPHHHSAMLKKIYLHCETAIKELDEVLVTLDKGLKQSGSRARKTWHAFRVVMKGSTLEDLMEKLERAKSMLNLASQCHIMTMQKALITMTLSSTRDSIHKSPTETIATNSQMQTRSAVAAKPKKGRRYAVESVQSYGLITHHSSTITLSKASDPMGTDEDNTIPDDENEIEIHSRWLPKAWFFSRGISLMRSRKYGQWKYCLRPIHIVSKDSPTFKMCDDLRRGPFIDPKETFRSVVKLIQDGKGSVFDTTPNGRTLLHAAAASMNPDLCRWLLAQGLQGNETEVKRNRTALHLAAEKAWHIRPWRKDPARVYDTIRVLVELGQCDPTSACENRQDAIDLGVPITALHIYTGSPDGFLYMINQEVFPTSIEFPELAVGVFRSQNMQQSSGSTMIAEMMRIRFDLSGNDLTWSEQASYVWSTLACQLRVISGVFGAYTSENTRSDLTSPLRALLKAGIDISPLHYYGYTPLSFNFDAFFYIWRDICIENLPGLLWAEFELLRETGHDIQKYLRRESELWREIGKCPDTIRRAVEDIHIEQYPNSLALSVSLLLWDLQDTVRLNWKPRPKSELPGAWVDAKAEQEEFDAWYFDFRWKLGRPNWAPDLVITFTVGPLEDGTQEFRLDEVIMRRVCECSCKSLFTCEHPLVDFADYIKRGYTDSDLDTGSDDDTDSDDDTGSDDDTDSDENTNSEQDTDSGDES